MSRNLIIILNDKQDVRKVLVSLSEKILMITKSSTASGAFTL